VRVAADTNVVVRYLTGDDASQSRAAKAALEAADAIYLDIVVLCETVWVLRRAFRLSPGEICAALTDLLDSEKIEVDRRAADAGLAMLEAGGDFADGVILHEAASARFDALITFDRRLARLAADKGVVLLADDRAG